MRGHLDTDQVPLVSWQGEDWLAREELLTLERSLAPGLCCGCASVQIAIQVCLELLGTRDTVIHTVLPVTAPPDTLAAVLRSGAHPVLLDINEETLQIEPEQLKDVLKEVETPIVVLTRPRGDVVDPRLLELVQDLPTILDSRLVPHMKLHEDDLSATFNIFDLTPMVGAGSVVLHSHEAQIEHLKYIVGGFMGHSGVLPERLAAEAKGRIKEFPEYLLEYRKCVHDLSHKLSKLPNVSVCPASEWPHPLYLEVEDASNVVISLKEQGIEAALGMYPLYELEEVKKRYVEDPVYPVAAKLKNKYVCIPTHPKTQKHIPEIVEIIKEVTE